MDMTKKTLAKEIMTTEVVTVNSDDTIEKVAQLMLKHHVSGMPVVDGEGKLVGIISEGDLLIQDKEIKAPAMTVFFGGIIYLENPSRFNKELKRIIALKVSELMSTKVYTVGPEDPIEKVIGIISEKEVNRVPVVDENKRLLGIISRQDIIKAKHVWYF
ncbi:MAG: CBS domain-containing protein [Peptococcaceae bacterium]